MGAWNRSVFCRHLNDFTPSMWSFCGLSRPSPRGAQVALRGDRSQDYELSET